MEEVELEAARQIAAEVIEKSYSRLSSRSRLRLPARYHWLSDASDRWRGRVIFLLCRRRYYAVGHHKAGLRPLCTDLYGPPAPQTAHHSNIASCSRSHCAPGAFLHFGAPLPRCRGPPFSRFSSPQNLEKTEDQYV